MPTQYPKASIPPHICSDVPGSWAYDTMSRRVREDILARVFRENNFDPHSIARLQALENELLNASKTFLSPLPDDGGPDVIMWNQHILEHPIASKQTWLSAPFAVAEFYLYRRILTAINYFSNPIDPFTLQKELGLTSAIESMTALAIRVNNTLASSSIPTQRLQQFQGFVLTSLWGNRMDLSLWPVGGQGETSQLSSGKRTADSFANVLEIGKNMILANDINHLCRYVDQLPPTRMDIVVDNAGFELFCDLCLADFLISSEIASQVHLQLKAHPTFVSDAMSKDVSHTIHFLQTTRTQDGQESPTSALGNRWADYVATGRWVLTEHFFWVQPQAMWEMPNALKMELSNSALVFVKGDANYRRLLGERHWDFDTPFNDVLCYFPAPICALRTLKAEIGCGMSKEATMRASQQDVNWLVAGKYGVIQFCDTRSL